MSTFQQQINKLYWVVNEMTFQLYVYVIYLSAQKYVYQCRCRQSYPKIEAYISHIFNQCIALEHSKYCSGVYLFARYPHLSRYFSLWLIAGVAGVMCHHILLRYRYKLNHCHGTISLPLL